MPRELVKMVSSAGTGHFRVERVDKKKEKLNYKAFDPRAPHPTKKDAQGNPRKGAHVKYTQEKIK